MTGDATHHGERRRRASPVANDYPKHGVLRDVDLHEPKRISPLGRPLRRKSNCGDTRVGAPIPHESFHTQRLGLKAVNVLEQEGH